MTSVEEVRQAVTSAFKTVHGANYPLVKVNYPNLTVVDIEHQRDPFVSIYLDLKDIQRAALGETELLVPGKLLVYFYYREGTGTSAAWQYTDMLNTYLCMQQVGPIYYHEVKPLPISHIPGWPAILNSIKFNLTSALNC